MLILNNDNAKDDLVYPKLSYKIVGIIYDVYNELGYGYQEKYYQKALAIRFNKYHINYTQQIGIDLEFDNHKIGKYILDFLIENKIILELKVGQYFYKKDYEQIRAYLKAQKLRLGMLILFTKNDVKIKRIINKI